jgi:hypothetical protein
MNAPQEYELLATELATMARELANQGSLQDTLDSIVTHAVKLVDGCEAAGILTVRHGEVRTLTTTDPVAQVSDRMQAMFGEGPCLDATVQGQQVYRIADMDAAPSRWPRYAEEAAKLGVGSVMGFLLYTNGRDNLGALDMYSSARGAFGPGSEQVGWLLASHAAVAMSSARHVANMDIALASSRLIGEAIGVVMSRYKISDEAAFDAIRRTSQNKNVKVRELAETITRTGQLPDDW